MIPEIGFTGVLLTGVLKEASLKVRSYECCLSYSYSCSLTEAKAGTAGRNLEARTDTEAMEGCCFVLAARSLFPYNLRGGFSHRGLGPSHINC